MAVLTLADLRSDVRSLILEPAAHMFSDAELRTWLNFGIRDFSSKVLWYSRIIAMDVVANQFEYNLPSDIMKLELSRFQEKYRVRNLDAAQWANVTFIRNNQIGTYPYFAHLYPHDKRIAIFPYPQSTSPATTINVGGGINSSVTSITVADTSLFPSFGYLLIESEQIRYFSKSATQFLQCRRGDGDTTAAAHADTTAVKAGEFQFYTRSLPPDLSADTDIPKLPNEYIEAIVYYSAHRAYLKRQLYEQASGLFQFYLQKRKEAAEEREQASLDIQSGVKDEEFGQGYNGEDQ